MLLVLSQCMPEKPPSSPFVRERLQPGHSLPTSLSQREQPFRSYLVCSSAPAPLSGSPLDPLQFSSLSLELGAQDRTLQHWPLSTFLNAMGSASHHPSSFHSFGSARPLDSSPAGQLMKLSLLYALFPNSKNYVGLWGKGKSKCHGQNINLWLR